MTAAAARDFQTHGLRPDASFKEAAIFYAVELGWSVFPTRPGTKEPYANTDHGLTDADKGKGGYKVATHDPATIKQWAERWPQANIGIAIDGFIVVEADVRHDGPANLERFRAQHGIVIDTVEARSASGGPHYFFRDVPGLRRAINAIPGVDVLTSGKGYVMVSPSRKGEGVYTWVKGRAPWEREMAELPAALREAAEQRHAGRAYSYTAKTAAGGNSASRSQAVGNLDAYMTKVRDNVFDAITRVKAGQRRDVLNRESFTLGRFVGGGYIGRTEARDLIVSAFQRAGHSLDPKAEDTIDVGLDEGAAQPIRLIVEERIYSSADEWDQQAKDNEDIPHDDDVIDAGILQKLTAERAAHKAERVAHRETRRQLAGYLRLMHDTRLTAGQRVATMITWAENDGPPQDLFAATDDDPTDKDAPIEELEKRGYQRLYIKSTAEKKAGMNDRVFGRTVTDAASIGLLKMQTRTEATQVPLDPDITPAPTRGRATPAIKYKYCTAIYVKPGALPDRKLNKKDVQDKAVRLVADAERKERRCPGCGSLRLKGVTYQCESCHCTCTREEAEHAGATMKKTAGGVWVNEHGEILHNGKQQWGSEGLWQEGEDTDTADNDPDDAVEPCRNPTPNMDSGQARRAGSPVYFSSPLITQEGGEEKYTGLRSDIVTGGCRIPTTNMAASKDPPACPSGEDLRPCYECGVTLTPHGLTCKPCRLGERPPSPLHIVTRTQTREGVSV